MSDPLDVLAPEHRRLRIGDTWCAATSGDTFAVEDPATGEVVAEVPDAGAEDGLAALEAASAAQRRRYFNTRLPGKSAAGHSYPDELTESEKQAVLEYLKTL